MRLVVFSNLKDGGKLGEFLNFLKERSLKMLRFSAVCQICSGAFFFLWWLLRWSGCTTKGQVNYLSAQVSSTVCCLFWILQASLQELSEKWKKKYPKCFLAEQNGDLIDEFIICWNVLHQRFCWSLNAWHSSVVANWCSVAKAKNSLWTGFQTWRRYDSLPVKSLRFPITVCEKHRSFRRLVLDRSWRKWSRICASLQRAWSTYIWLIWLI